MIANIGEKNSTPQKNLEKYSTLTFIFNKYTYNMSFPYDNMMDAIMSYNNCNFFIKKLEKIIQHKHLFLTNIQTNSRFSKIF